MTEAAVALRLPVATLPDIVLPGSVITLALADSPLRRAVEAAAAGDRRIALRSDHSELGVLARVPDIG
ncbi:MAG: hypothetical protein H0X61_14820, partial [Acidimicrobiia bacterium]|nr:hypothetical protein [Acidimicrobiia bacterium]